MTSVITLLLVIALSLLVSRVATSALALTGLSRESARFQARSALTGVGFTTSEAESVVNHPVRRRILMLLMLVGNAGILTVLATLVITFIQPASEGDWPRRIAVLGIGLGILRAAAASSWVERRLRGVIERALRRFTDLQVRDFENLLHLAEDFSVSELHVEEGDWVEGKDLSTLALRDEGVAVLGIHREDGGYVGAPKGDTTIERGDLVVLYGPGEQLAELDERRPGDEGDEQHREAVERERERRSAEEVEERARTEKREQKRKEEAAAARKEDA